MNIEEWKANLVKDIENIEESYKTMMETMGKADKIAETNNIDKDELLAFITIKFTKMQKNLETILDS